MIFIVSKFTKYEKTKKLSKAKKIPIKIEESKNANKISILEIGADK
tara:strand:- start:49 stop:186 length:138 start_codon:yes stop_codon:yes gene_type:complete